MPDLKFTLGFAMFDQDVGGVYPESLRAIFVAMSALVHHPLVKQVVVVDNNPQPKNTLPQFLAKTGRAKYVSMPEPQGTSAPRNRVFEEADSEYVACIDGHVLLYPGFFESLSQFYHEYGLGCQDLLHGPMMTERGEVMATHMNDQWRSEMWGTWGRMWKHPNGSYFSCVNDDGNEISFVTFDGQGNSTPAQMNGLKMSGWAGHERLLVEAGATPVLEDPFPIPGHGMGFFACRKDSWLPFHPDCRGFGGEEMTTGVRYRMAGRRCWCVPGAKWWHHFERPWTGARGAVGAPYAVHLWDRVRNYVKEFQRLGLPLDPIYHHFKSTSRGMPDSEWKQMVGGAEWPTPAADVAIHSYQPARIDKSKGGCAVTGEGGNEIRVKGLESLFSQKLLEKSNIQADMAHLRGLAARCGGDAPGRVVEIGTHTGLGTLALLAAKPRLLHTYHPEAVQLANTLQRFVPDGVEYAPLLCPDSTRTEITECDLLFLNPEPHTAQRIATELAKHSHKVHRFIAFHGHSIYGEKYNAEPGIFPAVRGFLAQNKEWKVVAKYDTPSGLLVLSKDPRDVPATPIQLTAGAVRQQIPDHGPGTELAAIFEGLGKTVKPACDCKGKAAQMNLWGVAGCKANFWTIVGWLKDNAVRWGWADAAPEEGPKPGVFSRMGTAIRVVFTGLTFRIDPNDPFVGFVTEAITRAEAKEKAK